MGDSVEKKAENKPDKKAKTSKPSFFKGVIKGVKSEFKKITWPDKHSTFKQSVAVVSISIVVGVIIAILDFVLQYGVNFLTSL